MTAASATVSQRTTRPATRWSRGSKSSAMRAVGTVSAVYRSPSSRRPAPTRGCRLADTCRVTHWVVRRSRRGHHRALAGGRAGARCRLGGRHEAADLGGSAGSSPASGPWGDGPGVEGQHGTGCAWHDVEPHREPSCRWTCWAGIEVRTAAGARVDLRRPPRPGPLRPAGARPPPAVARGDRRRPLARIRRTSAGSLRQALWLVRHGLSDAGLPPDSVLDVSTESIGDPGRREHRPRHRRLRGVPRRHACGAERADRAVRRRSRRGPRARLLRRRARAPRRPLRGRPRRPSPSAGSPTATCVARARRRSASSRAIRSARRPTRS